MAKVEVLQDIINNGEVEETHNVFRGITSSLELPSRKFAVLGPEGFVTTIARPSPNSDLVDVFQTDKTITKDDPWAEFISTDGLPYIHVGVVGAGESFAAQHAMVGNRLSTIRIESASLEPTPFEKRPQLNMPLEKAAD